MEVAVEDIQRQLGRRRGRDKIDLRIFRIDSLAGKGGDGTDGVVMHDAFQMLINIRRNKKDSFAVKRD